MNPLRAHLFEAPPEGALAIGVSPASPAVRLQALRDEETRLLATAVGEHLAPEIAQRVEAIRIEMSQLQGTR